MINKTLVFKKIKNHLLYGGIEKTEYDQVKSEIAKANLKALRHWSVMVSFFWIYCLTMAFFKDDYAMCRPAYIIALSCTVASYFFSRFLVPHFPNTLVFFRFLFRLSLLGGGIGIAVCQWDVRSLTLFAVSIISPVIFVDSTLSAFAAHLCTLVIYIFAGINVINPDIFYWGLANFMLFSVFGFLIGNAINKERFKRYVYAEYEKKLAEVQMRYAYIDRLTGLKNRHAFEDMLAELAKDPLPEFCFIMADINGLKATNDTIGHNAGDELIIGTSECMKEAFAGIDAIYRIGGDEFCIIMTGSVEKAQLCISKLDELTAKWRGRYINGFSVSTGIASVNNHENVEAALAEADEKMYEYKRNYYLSLGVERKYH